MIPKGRALSTHNRASLLYPDSSLYQGFIKWADTQSGSADGFTGSDPRAGPIQTRLKARQEYSGESGMGYTHSNKTKKKKKKSVKNTKIFK